VQSQQRAVAADEVACAVGQAAHHIKQTDASSRLSLALAKQGCHESCQAALTSWALHFYRHPCFASARSLNDPCTSITSSTHQRQCVQMR
jgi:hypothetical protein